jgi:hypothetical protein
VIHHKKIDLFYNTLLLIYQIRINQMATQIPKIEKYIREMIAANGGSFDREAIFMLSKDWIVKFPVEFNSVLNMIEAEGRNVGCDEMDDSTSSVAYHGVYTDDSMPSVTYNSGYSNESKITNIFYEYKYADDSTPSAAHYDEYNGNIMPDHMSSIADSPMGSDHIDSSPGGYPDDDSEFYMPLQRTISHAPPANKF